MNKILLAYDGGDPARRALDTAAELARLTGASVAVVSVVPTNPGRFPVDPWDDTSVHAQELLEARRIAPVVGHEDLVRCGVLLSTTGRPGNHGPARARSPSASGGSPSSARGQVRGGRIAPPRGYH